MLTGFTADSLDLQLSLGLDQFVTPPDTQVAVGPAHILEMVNSSGSVWDKSGNRLSLFDLNQFFAVPAGYSFSDPRVLYDQDSGRWFASGVAFVPPTYASVITIAVSTSSDPTGTWVQYNADNSSNLTHDQPKIGVSSDKVVISWNDFLYASFFEGQSTWVLQKSQMVAGSSPVNGAALGPDSSRSSPVPAVQISSTPTAYVVYNRTDCATLGGSCTSPGLGFVQITGTPLQGNVAWNESVLPMAATSQPPNADQPGMPGSIATNDDRFLSAVYENGVLWAGGNDACLPPQDATVRSCARFVQVLTSTSTVNQNFDIGLAGASLYYPAFGMDAGGNMYAVYNLSSASDYIGVRVTGQPAGAQPQTLVAAQTIKSGETTYNMNPCFGTAQASRWGDYSGAGIDPQAPGNVWVAGEYAAVGSAANGDAGCDWATYIASLTFSTSGGAGATLTSISPTSGPAAGGTTVTVLGSGFDTTAGGTLVYFGATAATGVSCSSGTQCTATSPSGVGSVAVTVTVDGQPATGSATFTYIPSLSSISPTSGSAAGGTTVTITGTGFDVNSAATVFYFGSSPATGVSCSSSSQCTAVTPAGSQGAVTVSAVVDGQTSSNTLTFRYRKK